jgi:hypothetical protein
MCGVTLENWRLCVQNDAYEVSDLGNVRRVKPAKGAKVGKILRPGYLKAGGYAIVALSTDAKPKTYAVHLLVAAAFLDGFGEACLQVAHSDGNPRNNALSNLRMATPKENCADQLIHGTRSRGSHRPLAKLSEAQIQTIRADQRISRLIAKEYGVSRQLIDGIKNGVRWAHV